MTIRIAAVGDVHLAPGCEGSLRHCFDVLAQCADVLLLAGDLTRHGTMDEALVVAREFAGAPVPVVAVLGNHDYHADCQDEITALLEEHGTRVLERAGTVVEAAGRRIGVAGTKGFGGGFAGRTLGCFGEPQIKQFVRHTQDCADGLRAALDRLAGQDCDARIALTHYSPVPDTLAGEPLEIFPFLGSYLLAEAIDAAGADLSIHGHAHSGTERGMTAGGVRVRNVAQPVIRRAFAVYHLHEEPDDALPGGAGRQVAEPAASR